MLASPDSVTVDPRFRSAKTIFFVIGAQKAGTTWLQDYAGKHPQISVPTWKELNYWKMLQGDTYLNERLTRLRKSREAMHPFIRQMMNRGIIGDYKMGRGVAAALKVEDNPGVPHTAYADALFQRANRKTKAVGEICPQYASLSEESFATMNALGENVRFVYLLRDPVARLISSLRHRLRHYEKAVSAENLNQSVSETLAGDLQGPLVGSFYDQHMARLEAVIPSDQIKYVFYEDLFDQSTLASLCAFLGVDAVKGDVETVVHKGSGENSDVADGLVAQLARLLTPTYDNLRTRFGTLPAAWESSAAKAGAYA